VTEPKSEIPDDQYNFPHTPKEHPVQNKEPQPTNETKPEEPEI
jgi:hypothetical protein